MNVTEEVIAGTRPADRCIPDGSHIWPDGSHIWVTRTLRDNRWDFTVFNGWLIAEETTTTNPHMAAKLTDIYKGETK